MIRFIYGSAGCGKTRTVLEMIQQDISRGMHTFLIVPEQEVLQVERLTLSALPMSAQLDLEVLSFSRLYNRVCREYGGISHTPMNDVGRYLMMWKDLRTVKCLLKYFNEPMRDPRIADDLLASIAEFNANGISVSMLESAADRLADAPHLSLKLKDLALIYETYNLFLNRGRDYCSRGKTSCESCPDRESCRNSADELTRLCDILDRHPFFENTCVYIDSFSSFTAAEHKIIEHMAKSASSLTVTFPFTSPKTHDISAESVVASYNAISSIAGRYAEVEELALTKRLRKTAPRLEYLARTLWDLGATASNEKLPPEEDEPSIVYEVCKNRYTESEAVAAHILELLRRGERCRDMVIIARDTEKYRGILDTALAKSGINFFLSEKSDLCSNPSVKFILSALKVGRYNWQKEDVLSFLKTGLCAISPTDAAFFDEYVTTWNIRGNMFFVDGDWGMNPDGFSQKVTSRGEEILLGANRVKNAIVPPLRSYLSAIHASCTVAEKCRDTYEFILAAGLENSLQNLARAAARRGDLKGAQEMSRIYATLLETFDLMITMVGDEEVSDEEFFSLVQSVFNRTQIGTIPTSVDEVTIGSAPLLRPSSPKYAFVLGLCEGDFPATLTSSGILSSTDREALLGIGLELSGTSTSRLTDEWMYVLRAFSAPSDRLYLFSYQTRSDGKNASPSIAISRVQKLFGDLKVHEYRPTELTYPLPAPKNACAIYRSLPPSTKKVTLKAALCRTIPGFSLGSDIPSVIDQCHILRKNSSRLRNYDIMMSFSDLEKYHACPFNFYCSVLLGLREQKTARFDSNNVGSLGHLIFETLLKKQFSTDTPNFAPSSEELKSEADATISEYNLQMSKTAIFPQSISHIQGRVRDRAVVALQILMNEFSDSDFRPAFFELSITKNDLGLKPLKIQEKESNSFTAHLSGTIDRVDLYRSDEGDLFVRVVDYKSSAKSFSQKNEDSIEQMQLPIYLFTLSKSNSRLFKSNLGVSEEQRIHPAAFSFFSGFFDSPPIEPYSDASARTDIDIISKSINRSGVILDDEKIRNAYSKSRVYDLKLSKSDAEFEEYYEQISDVICQEVLKMSRGEFSCTKEKCNSYCPNSAVCKHITSKN